jgi:hypothetical protein
VALRVGGSSCAAWGSETLRVPKGPGAKLGTQGVRTKLLFTKDLYTVIRQYCGTPFQYHRMLREAPCSYLP